MRQKDDLIFAQALNHLVTGTLTPQEVELFSKRTFHTYANLPPIAKSAINLFPFNKLVDEFNEIRLSETKDLPGVKRFISQAIDKIIGAKSLKQKNTILASIKMLPSKDTNGLPYSLILQTGRLYMVTTNIDVSDGLFNGVTGTLEEVTVTKNNIPSVAWILFNDPQIGAEARSKFNQVKGNLVPIPIIQRPINRPSSYNCQVRIVFFYFVSITYIILFRFIASNFH